MCVCDKGDTKVCACVVQSGMCVSLRSHPGTGPTVGKGRGSGRGAEGEGFGHGKAQSVLVIVCVCNPARATEMVISCIRRAFEFGC